MANNIVEMERLTDEAEEAVKKMEDGNRAAPDVALDVGYLEID